MSRCYSVMIIAAAASFGWVTPADAGPVFIQSGARHAPDVIAINRLETMKGIASASETQRRLDGGTLTPEHLAKFQRRLDRANDDYRRELANNNPLTVDADGHVNHVPPYADWTWSDLARVGTAN